MRVAGNNFHDVRHTEKKRERERQAERVDESQLRAINQRPKRLPIKGKAWIDDMYDRRLCIHSTHTHTHVLLLRTIANVNDAGPGEEIEFK